MWRGTSVYRTHDGRPTAPCPVLQIVGVVSARLERCERLVDTFNPFGSEKWLGYIMTIGVAEVYRCRGIGSRLLQVRRRRPADPLRTHSPMRSGSPRWPSLDDSSLTRARIIFAAVVADDHQVARERSRMRDSRKLSPKFLSAHADGPCLRRD
jgi:hypothetical protein